MKWVYSGYSTATPSSSNLIKSYDYVYSSSMDDMEWDDLLTEYDGEAIVYDNIGNPTTYRGKTMLWEGRNLTAFYDSDTAALYGYDASGIRTMKYYDGKTYNYYYIEGKLMSETCPQYDLFYTYDSRGNLSGIKKVTADGTTTNYGVLSNMFGDVLGIFDLSGNLLAKYTYDSWGKLLSITNASGTDISSTDGIWTQNSIRYRGYVYDNESGWYYLQSRYYDPEICRFINADGMISTTTDFAVNLYSYCNCNPLIYQDSTGKTMKVNVAFFEIFYNAVTSIHSLEYEQELDSTPKFLPLVISIGDIYSYTNPLIEEKPISIFQTIRVDNIVYSKTVLQIILQELSFSYNFGLDDYGFSVDFNVDDYTTITISNVSSFSKLYVGMQIEEKITKPDGTAISSYLNVSVNAWSIICIYALFKGVVLPTEVPNAYRYSFVPVYS